MKYLFRVINKMGTFAWVSILVGVVALSIPIIVAPWFAIPFVALLVVVFWKFMVGPLANAERLQEVGIEASAKILAFKENGSAFQMGGALPKAGVTMLLETHPPGGTPYQVEHKTFLSVFDIKNTRVGNTVRIKIDPQNPKDITVLDVTGPLSMFKN